MLKDRYKKGIKERIPGGKRVGFENIVFCVGRAWKKTRKKALVQR